MDYQGFMETILGYIGESGEKVFTYFNQNPDKGTFYARCSNGVEFNGRPGSYRISVKWGSGHKSYIDVVESEVAS